MSHGGVRAQGWNRVAKLFLAMIALGFAVVDISDIISKPATIYQLANVDIRQPENWYEHYNHAAVWL